MLTFALARRAPLGASLGLALAGLVGSQTGLAQSARPFHDIWVDVAPLRANAGDTTAAWVEQLLPQQLAHALAGRLARTGGTLVVRIDTLSLGPNGGGNGPAGSPSLDNISGVAIVDGVHVPVRATTSYFGAPEDQTMMVQASHDRVSDLTQALAYWISQNAAL